jgi:HEAT repeat protein
MDDDVLETRLQAVLSASRYGRDDLLPGIRARSTHLNSAEQEACARALGELRDSSSIPRLKRLAQASAPALRLAALQSLFALGDAAAAEPIRQMAQQQQPFAIALLGALPGSEEALLPLLRTEALQVRLNAALSLLRLRDARCLPTLYEVLLRDGRDLGFQPHFSPGGSLMAWKAIPSFAQHADHEDLAAASLGMREQTLRFCIELPELAFLEIAETLFLSKQGELIPQVIALLENKRSPASIRLLKRYAQRAGAPLVRAYCNLALYRLGEQGPYRDAVKAWILQNKQAEMIRFRPMLPWHFRALEGAFSLTPEESSRLLIDSYMALAERHEVENIDLLLQAIKEGNRKNRYVLAGLLIRALE